MPVRIVEVGGDIALAAAGGDDHVGGVEQFGLAGDPGIVQRQSCGVNADALPQLHLPLVALFRNLFVEIHRRERVHDIGRKALVVVRWRIAAFEMLPCRLEPLAKACEQTDAGDPHLAASAHFVSSLIGTSMRSAHSNSAVRNSGLGNGMIVYMIRALADDLSISSALAFADRVARALMHDAAFDFEFVAWKYCGTELRVFDAGHERHGVKIVHRNQQPAGGLRHAFKQQRTRHQRITREVAFEDCGRFRHRANGSSRAPGNVERDHAVDHLEVFETHARRLRRLSPRSVCRFPRSDY